MSALSLPADYQARLAELMLRDERRLRRRIAELTRSGNHDGNRREWTLLESDVEKAFARVQRRRESVPAISFPADLPVSQRKQDLAEAIRDNQVVVVAGETGSGKTTQLPKICLELGRGIRGYIGHTQPRRLAARTVAERIAEELHTELGKTVGYRVRFTDKVANDTLIKLMTDGILLAEIQSDRLLRQYDTIIIDEAHERSLNIDFLLGYIKQLLPKRPDLKVIITSATIDPERFAQHFAVNGKPAPIVEVSGRTYPVEIRYRPIIDDTVEGTVSSETPKSRQERDQTEAICDAVVELGSEAPGDILVFLSGEREIRDTAQALADLKLTNTEILPLYARLSSKEQHKIFQPHVGRRIVLATNVAETSLTVPGIKYVIDPGTARISRYSHRTKVQRLPIEAISQASANQRAGRCGRTSDGICLRLYSEQDFLSRPEFTDPEILRTNLASVILHMASIGLGDIADFPFVEPPDRRQVTDGIHLLHELGAFSSAHRKSGEKLTTIGYQLAQLPVDPRLGRMVLEASRNGCVREVMIIVAALSIQDPRERPADYQQASDEKHRRFSDETSDFQAYLNLWDYLAEKQQSLSNSQFRKLCTAEFLNYLRIREWQDIYSQLRQVIEQNGITLNTIKPDSHHVHTSLLAGLLSHIGVKDPKTGDYFGSRNTRFAIFPGSGLFKKSPRWVMSAELVETARLWGRINAKIEPEWVEPLADHLVKRQYSEPHWSRRRAAVMASERVTLYGVPIVVGRKVNYGRIEPIVARELFIRHALVEGDWDTLHEFFRANRALLDDVIELENRARRRDILVDDETLFEFYDRRLGDEVVSGRHFDSWWKKTRLRQPDLLNFEKTMLVNDRAADVVDQQQYPDTWTQGNLTFPLTYQFEPGSQADGVTAHVPLSVLNQVRPEQFRWQVPGLRHELLAHLIRALPKPLRRNFVPVPDTVTTVLNRITPQDGDLHEVLAEELSALRDVEVSPDAWNSVVIPEHLTITFSIEDTQGKVLGFGKDLAVLQRNLNTQAMSNITRSTATIAESSITGADFADIPQVFEGVQKGYQVKAYPALVADKDAVSLKLLANPVFQQQEMPRGTRKLLQLNMPSPVKFVTRNLSNQSKLTLNNNPHGSVAALLQDCIDCAIDSLVAELGGPAWSGTEFRALLERVRPQFNARTVDVLARVEPILAEFGKINAQLADTSGPAESLDDIGSQLTGLIYPGFIAETGFAKLPDLVRYLRAVERRLTKLPTSVTRDLQGVHEIRLVQHEFDKHIDSLPPGLQPGQELRYVRWMIEEFRVSHFAQTLGTAYPISIKRILKALDSVGS